MTEKIVVIFMITEIIQTAYMIFAWERNHILMRRVYEK